MDASHNTEDGTKPGVEALLARRIAAAAPGTAVAEEGQLYRLLAPRARRYGLRHLRDPHAAADLMQHVMALTIEQLRSGALREPERVVSFVLGACRMTAREVLRSHRRREALLQRLWGGEAQDMDNALHATVYRLRKRMEKNGRLLSPLQAVPRVGYEFRAPLRLA